ncbi:hypothetical protein O181_022715 [Austropuccinia psidii MF-1]|uniref:Uncharacterized protein n=1 Tax=Austropuccinia psidii MF-1 TaxID=1389203 RepID=A0A9Q3CHX9_9BASI|nr:hypothetical protein [Austropuccinia psidii MF-1]
MTRFTTHCPSFQWPHQWMISETATQLYFEDQSPSYLAIVMQWIDPLTYSFHKTLVAFESMLGMHTGMALSWKLWEALLEGGMIK